MLLWVAPERVNKVAVIIYDSVRDGCWPRPSATREAVELVFRSAGIEVFEQRVPYDSGLSAAVFSAPFTSIPGDKGWPHAFVVASTGYKARIGQTPVGCAVSIEARLQRYEILRDFKPVGLVSYGRTSLLISGPPDEYMQRAITETATEAAKSLANAILKVR